MNLTVKKDAKQSPEQIRRHATQAPVLPGNAFPSSTKKTSRKSSGTSEAPNAAQLALGANKDTEAAASVKHEETQPRSTRVVSAMRGEGLEGRIDKAGGPKSSEAEETKLELPKENNKQTDSRNIQGEENK